MQMERPVVVLVVEDEELIQDVVEEVLEEGGYRVAKAFSAEYAIQMLKDGEGATFRALVTDVNLGSGQTGWDVAHRARELFPELPVIYTTTANANDWRANGVPNSILITKPFAPAQLVSAVSQLINAASSPAN